MLIFGEWESGRHCTTQSQTSAWYGGVEVARVLLEHEPDVNSRDDNGLTPLHLLIADGYFDKDGALDFTQFTQLLLEHGADVNTRMKDGWTPLHSAAFYGMLKVVRVLLDHGANVIEQNDQGETPLHLVSRGRYDSHQDGVSIARLLLARGVDVNAKNKNHDTPWLQAALNGRLEILQVLLEHGANANTESGQCDAPMTHGIRGEYRSQEHAICLAIRDTHILY